MKNENNIINFLISKRVCVTVIIHLFVQFVLLMPYITVFLKFYYPYGLIAIEFIVHYICQIGINVLYMKEIL